MLGWLTQGIRMTVPGRVGQTLLDVARMHDVSARWLLPLDVGGVEGGRPHTEVRDEILENLACEVMGMMWWLSMVFLCGLRLTWRRDVREGARMCRRSTPRRGPRTCSGEVRDIKDVRGDE